MTTSLHSATLDTERKYILSIDQGTTSSRATNLHLDYYH